MYSSTHTWTMGSLETSLGLLFCGPLSIHQALTAAGRVLFPSLLGGRYISPADLRVSAWLVGQTSQLQGPAEQAFQAQTALLAWKIRCTEQQASVSVQRCTPCGVRS